MQPLSLPLWPLHSSVHHSTSWPTSTGQSFHLLHSLVSLLWQDALRWALICDSKISEVCASPRCPPTCLHSSPPVSDNPVLFFLVLDQPVTLLLSAPKSLHSLTLGYFSFYARCILASLSIRKMLFPSPLTFKVAPEHGCSRATGKFSLYPQMTNQSVKQVQVWAACMAPLPSMAIGMGCGRGAYVTIESDTGIWATCSYSLPVFSGPARPRFGTYHFHLY